MDVREVAGKRNILENDIREYLIGRLDKFFTETSLAPTNIFIDLENVYTMGDSIPHHVIVGKVEVRIEL